MGANSAVRKIVKRLIHPLLSERHYIRIQAISQARDIESGLSDEPEVKFVYRSVKEGDTCLDLGANFGQYAYHLSKAVGESGQVFSFEPVPYTFKTLAQVVERLGLSNVEIVNKGCSDKNESVVFELPIQESGAYSAGQAYIGERDDDRKGKETQVRWSGVKQVKCEVVRLDDFLPDLENLTLVKADVEGAELFAFKGGEKLIDKFLPHVICEINPWFFDGFGIDLSDLTSFFFEKGYRLYFFESDGASDSLTEVSPEEIVEDNYIFIHSSKIENFSSLVGS